MQICYGSAIHVHSLMSSAALTRSLDMTGESTSLSALTSRPDYFGRVGELIRNVASAADEAVALEILKEATLRMGADVAAFVSFIRDDPTHESFRFLLACDIGWCIEYEQRAWYADDPWLEYARHHTEPTLARNIPIGTKQQAAIADMARRFGFASGVIVPAPSSGGSTRLGVLCLGSTVPGYFEDEGFQTLKVVAIPLAVELQAWWSSWIKGELVKKARISNDDLALLRLEKTGRTTKAIAAALGSSPSSIDSRFQRINAKLDVPNRAAAARLAAEYGLI